MGILMSSCSPEISPSQTPNKGNGASNLVRLTPTIEALTMMESEIKCPVITCKNKISRIDPLDHHIKRHICEFALFHGNLNIEYHCPVTECLYSVLKAQKSFTKLQTLKQHYKKVHLPKDFKCSTCTRSFGTQCFLNIHQKSCGVSYMCSCKKIYKTVESLKAHAKKKSHSYSIAKCDINEDKSVKDDPDLPDIQNNEKIELPSTSSSPRSSTPPKISTPPTISTPIIDSTLPTSSKTFQAIKPLVKLSEQTPSGIPLSLIYLILPTTFTPINFNDIVRPKLDFGTQTVPQSNRVSQSQHCQTDQSSNLTSSSHFITSTSQVASSRIKRKRSAETQTGRVRVKISAETQTSIVTKRRRCTRKKLSTQTQTQGLQVNTSPPKNEIFPSRVKTTVIPLNSRLMSCETPVMSTLQNQYDLFNELEEVHSQTQTEPDLLLGANFDFLDLDVDEVSEILRSVESKSAETQTQTLPFPSGSLEQTVPTASSPYSPSSPSFLFPDEGDTTQFFESFLSRDNVNDNTVGNAYLETMDSETQTQFATYTKPVP